MSEITTTAKMVVGGLTIAAAALAIANISNKQRNSIGPDPTADVSVPSSNLTAPPDTMIPTSPRPKFGINTAGLMDYHVKVRGTIKDNNAINRISKSFDNPIINDVREPVNQTSVESFVNGRTR